MCYFLISFNAFLVSNSNFLKHNSIQSLIHIYLKWIAISFDSGDDFLCENHEFSSTGNSVSCPVTENPILLGQTF